MWRGGGTDGTDARQGRKIRLEEEVEYDQQDAAETKEKNGSNFKKNHEKRRSDKVFEEYNPKWEGEREGSVAQRKGKSELYGGHGRLPKYPDV